jgi:hypothetical protein
VSANLVIRDSAAKETGFRDGAGLSSEGVETGRSAGVGAVIEVILAFAANGARHSVICEGLDRSVNSFGSRGFAGW